jgi:membrane protease YdiL (CAAX protease family)
MRKAFLNDDGQLRNGWKVLLFLLLTVGLFMVTGRIARAHIPFLKAHRDLLPQPLVMGLILLLSTWLGVKGERSTLAGLGLRPNGRWAREALLGAGFGVGIMLVAALAIRALGGFHWEWNVASTWRTVLAGAWLFLWVAFFEELAFRGFVFQRLVRGMGAWPTQLLLAGLFALGHWGNPGMHGAVKVWATLNISLAAILLGLAFLKTGSLALPMGIHLGWNWAQGNLLGFGVSGTAATGVLNPVFHGRPEWLTGGAFGPEASLPSLLVLGACCLWLARWKNPAPAPVGPDASRVLDAVV